jgi:hypothetical protein
MRFTINAICKYQLFKENLLVCTILSILNKRINQFEKFGLKAIKTDFSKKNKNIDNQCISFLK